MDSIYSALKDYRPTGLLLGRSTIGDAVLAIQTLNKYKTQMSGQLRKFATDVADDIQNYGTLPVYTIRRIARAGNIKAEDEAVQEYGEKCTGWRMDATLREFPRIEPVDLFFSYPLHMVDANAILKEANLEENERSMENGREMGNLSKAARKADNKIRLYEAVNRDIELTGKRKTYAQYADEFNVSEKTIKRYMSEWEEDI